MNTPAMKEKAQSWARILFKEHGMCRTMREKAVANMGSKACMSVILGDMEEAVKTLDTLCNFIQTFATTDKEKNAWADFSGLREIVNNCIQ